LVPSDRHERPTTRTRTRTVIQPRTTDHRLRDPGAVPQTVREVPQQRRGGGIELRRPDIQPIAVGPPFEQAPMRAVPAVLDGHLVPSTNSSLLFHQPYGAARRTVHRHT